MDEVYGEAVGQVVIACTDLNAVSAQTAPELPVIVSVRRLARAVVKNICVCVTSNRGIWDGYGTAA